MKLNSTPFSSVALPEFFEQYSDLIFTNKEIQDSDKIFIEYMLDFMWRDSFSHEEYVLVDRSARASYHFLSKGTEKSHKNVCIEFTKSLQNLPVAFNRCLNFYIKIKENRQLDLDDEIENYLKFYKTLYEGLSAYILAPIVYSFHLVNNIKNKKFIPNDEGKIQLSVLKEMEKWLIHPQNILATGLNNHIRNAHAHETYRIMDEGKVELWDQNPYKRDDKWGPEIWNVSQLKDLSRELWTNSFGIIRGLLIFSINNNRIIRERGWYSKTTRKIKYRSNELLATVSKIADDLSFDLTSINLEKKILVVEVKTRPKGIDQNEKLFFGGGSRTTRYALPVKYVKVKIVFQIFGLLQKIIELEDEFSEVKVEVFDYKDKYTGRLTLDKETLEYSFNLSESEFDKIEPKIKENTLVDSIMYVRIEGQIQKF